MRVSYTNSTLRTHLRAEDSLFCCNSVDSFYCVKQNDIFMPWKIVCSKVWLVIQEHFLVWSRQHWLPFYTVRHLNAKKQTHTVQPGYNKEKEQNKQERNCKAVQNNWLTPLLGFSKCLLWVCCLLHETLRHLYVHQELRWWHTYWCLVSAESTEWVTCQSRI